MKKKKKKGERNCDERKMRKDQEDWLIPRNDNVLHTVTSVDCHSFHGWI